MGHDTGWCNASVPICSDGTHSGWFGVGCDSTNSFVTSLQLGGNRLKAFPTPVDISPLFSVLAQLTYLDLSGSGALLPSRLDLSPLTNLIELNLGRGMHLAAAYSPLVLPTPVCQLRSINIDYTSFAVQSWTACTQLTTIGMQFVLAPTSLAMIAYMPSCNHWLRSCKHCLLPIQ